MTSNSGAFYVQLLDLFSGHISKTFKKDCNFTYFGDFFGYLLFQI